MDLNSVRMFVAVVQAGSLSTAAERVGIPLPTLSRRIRELESELNVRLFERHSQGVKVTEVGTRLYEHAARGIESLEDAERAVVSNDEAQLTGTLRLSIPPAFEPWWELVAEFQRQHRHVTVTVYTTERRVELVEDGIDVALRVGAIVHEQMVARKLFSYRHVLVASPKLLAEFGEPSSPDELRRFPCGVWRRDTLSNHIWQLGDQMFEPSATLVTNDYLHLRNRAISGDLVTELPPFLAREAVANGTLCLLLPEYPLPMQDISLLYPSRRFVPSIVRAYINFCQEQVVGFCEGKK
ncbi:LysR family transcriptional regulator [Solimicrobium silvestre]|uniref:Transcriptional regulator n=1 Tax=Solimicrobium silvestre TaxID=2099400 RepID=A0A2S9H3N0_9BURK|nr:LysR family transcriptional regulator [Solimicrobium silvestre]PRC94592.1 Transcriptional regulator [Solimicrobium silvestre]